MSNSISLEHEPGASGLGRLITPSGSQLVQCSDVSGLARAVARMLARDGIVQFAGIATQAQFHQLTTHLGVPWHELFVYPSPGEQNFVRNPNEVAFHTDSRRADLVGWYCVRPCSSGVANLYLDGWDACAGLTEAERAALVGVTCQDPLQQGRLAESGPEEPILELTDAGPRLFWLPHRLNIPEEGRRLAALRKLAARLSGEDDVRVVPVRLQRGNFVIIDNHRFLHGRLAIPADSPRLLYRLWINSSGWPDAEEHRVVSPTEPTISSRP